MSSSGNQLEGGLKSRHLTMLSIAGVIGGALFVGSGKVIANAGPAAILAYLGGGILVVLVMRMLGEMAVEEPVSGSFSYYADKYWGPFPGFMLGWNYWFSYVIISMAELTAVGIYVHYWLPDLPQ